MSVKRIGIIYPNHDPSSPKNWSGTPHGLFGGLETIGLEVVPIPCVLPVWRQVPIKIRSKFSGLGYLIVDRSPGYVRSRTQKIAESIERAGHLDGIIAMGTDVFDLALATRRSDVPLATYDDGTFPLLLRYADSHLSRLGLPADVLDSWIALQRTACRRADVACVSTQWAKQSMIEDFDIPEARVPVVGMGHRPRSNMVHDRQFDVPNFLFVGVEWQRKNGAAVVAAFAKVREQIPNATLHVVGSHPPLDQPGVHGYGFLARENADSQRLLDQLFSNATAFVLPSLFDPSPIAYLEAASSGLPVIATTCGGAGHLLGDAAISVDPYDHEALVDAMLRLSDAKIARAMGTEALARSASSRWQDVARRIVDSLAQVKTTRSNDVSALMPRASFPAASAFS